MRDEMLNKEKILKRFEFENKCILLNYNLYMQGVHELFFKIFIYRMKKKNADGNR